MSRLRFGILGSGSIAGEFADALQLAELCVPELVGSRDERRAAGFAAAHGVARAAGSYEQVLADPDVDVVYVATPHTEHARWAIAAIEAGKHVLCEKPLTVDERDARGVIEVADRHGAFLLEAFAYRFHPQTTTLMELIRGGAIGRLRAIDVTFSFDSPGDGGRAKAHALAGGGILDVGCYCTSMARQIVAAATGATAVEPQEVIGLAALDPVERTDLYAIGAMRFPGDVLAQLACGVALTQDDHVRVYGSGGQLHVPQPAWLDGRRDAASQIELTRADGVVERIDVPGGRNIFALEADGVARMLRDGVDTCRPWWDESLANMRTLDRWRSAVGVHYDFEAI